MKKVCIDCEMEFDPAMSFCLQCGKLLKPSDISGDRIVNCNFEYKCPLEWNNLVDFGNSDVRFCKNCEKHVYFAHTQTELDEFAGAGKCVAFHPGDAPVIEETFEHRPLMGIMIPPERMKELKEKAEIERQRAETKSWWKFWK